MERGLWSEDRDRDGDSLIYRNALSQNYVVSRDSSHNRFRKGEYGTRRFRRFLNSVLSDYDDNDSETEEEEEEELVSFEWGAHFVRVGYNFFHVDPLKIIKPNHDRAKERRKRRERKERKERKEKEKRELNKRKEIEEKLTLEKLQREATLARSKQHDNGNEQKKNLSRCRIDIGDTESIDSGMSDPIRTFSTPRTNRTNVDRTEKPKSRQLPTVHSVQIAQIV